MRVNQNAVSEAFEMFEYIKQDVPQTCKSELRLYLNFDDNTDSPQQLHSTIDIVDGLLPHSEYLDAIQNCALYLSNLGNGAANNVDLEISLCWLNEDGSFSQSEEYMIFNVAD